MKNLLHLLYVYISSLRKVHHLSIYSSIHSAAIPCHLSPLSSLLVSSSTDIVKILCWQHHHHHHYNASYCLSFPLWLRCSYHVMSSFLLEINSGYWDINRAQKQPRRKISYFIKVFLSNFEILNKYLDDFGFHKDNRP